MALTRVMALVALAVYIEAWETRDPDLIVTIFTPAATYHERVLGDPIRGHGGIRAYWESKVAGGQAHISCELLNVYLDGQTVIAEWEVCFDDVAQGVRKRMREAAFLVFEGERIASLREYWASEHVGELAPAE